MKAYNTVFRLKAVFLAIVMIFQSCAASYQGSYTLPQALAANREAQITTISNEQIEYKKIDTLNGKWVGQKVVNERLVYEPLNTQTITKIELKRTKESASKEGRKVIGIIATVALLGILLLNADFDLSKSN